MVNAMKTLMIAAAITLLFFGIAHSDPGDREFFQNQALPTLHPNAREYMCQYADSLVRMGQRPPRTNNISDCEISKQEGWERNPYLNDAKLSTEQNKILIAWGKYCFAHSNTNHEYLGCMWRRGFKEID